MNVFNVMLKKTKQTPEDCIQFTIFIGAQKTEKWTIYFKHICMDNKTIFKMDGMINTKSKMVTLVGERQEARIGEKHMC